MAAVLGKDGWIGVDLDGTLAKRVQGNKDPAFIGEPIQEMLDRVKSWLELGYEVRIFTARASGKNRKISTPAIKQWCKKHIGKELKVTCMKDHDCVEIWDDIAVTVERNTGKRLTIHNNPLIS